MYSFLERLRKFTGCGVYRPFLLSAYQSGRVRIWSGDINPVGEMKAVLIFDNVNDLLFFKWDDTFLERMKAFDEQANNPNEEGDGQVSDSHHVSQLLSPIITSQRVMAAQFGNTYSSMQCKDGTTIVFDEWLEHLFLIISEDNVDLAHRELLDCKTLVQHLCGQNINLLQSPIYQRWLSALLECRTKGDCVPGASGIMGESGATAAALGALRSAAKEVHSAMKHFHLLLYVGDKLLALYSSRGSEDLSPADLILLSVQCVAAQEYWSDVEKTDRSKDERSENSHLPWLSEENSAIVQVCAGVGGAGGPAAPHSLHLAAVAPRVIFAILIDMELRDIGVATSLSSQILSNVRRLLLQRNLELIPPTLDSLESSIKKLTEALRKNKSNAAICARLSTRMLELRKSCTTTTPLTPETTAAAMHTAIETVAELLRTDIPSLNLEPPLHQLRSILSPYIDFLRVKAMRYFSFQSGELASPSGSLSLHKYVEEFPGLVHFVYVDRTAGRFLAPDMADCMDVLTKEKVLQILNRSSKLVREGYTAATWLSGALHVTFILWWERGAAPARPAPLHPAGVRALPPPGDMQGAFYRQLTEQAFPQQSGNISVKELTCIHLGVVGGTQGVEQARRLASALRDSPAARTTHLL